MIVLPLREAVRSGAAGAVALTVAEFGRRSAMGDRLVVVGGTERGDYPMPYRRIEDRGWWRGLPGSALSRPSYRFGDAAARLAREQRAGLVEVHNSARLFWRVAGRLPADCPVCFQLHNDPHDMTGLRTAPERAAVLGRASLVYCLSDYIRVRFLEGLADPGDRVVTLANGVDVSAAPSSDADREPTILFVGRLNAEKGLDLLIDALRRLALELPTWRVALIGRLHERDRARYGEALKELEAAWGGRLSLRSGVPHEQVMQEFAGAAITLVPSIWPEPFGRVALEAMAAGSAVIASRSGGLPEIVGDAGVLLEHMTADTLSAAILSLASDPHRCAALGRAARARAEACFDIGLLSRRLDLYRTGLLTGGHAATVP